MSVKDAFRHIYATRAWSGEAVQDFDSGNGSDAKLTERYCDVVNRFVNDKSIRTIVDLGCGDFRVGRAIARPAVSYVGIDVVPELIEYNRQHFSTNEISFQCLDMTGDSLPDAELCIIRQVFQHLSNAQITMALQQCRKFKYVIVSEHIPTSQRARPNLDKPHGPDIRLYRKSGIFLEAPPFCEKIQVLCETSVDSQSVIRTVLIHNS